MRDLAPGRTRTGRARTTTTADLLRLALDEVADAYQRARWLVYDVVNKGQALTPHQQQALARLRASEANLAELRRINRERRSREAVAVRRIPRPAPQWDARPVGDA